MKRSPKLSRRNVLRGAGGIAVALPFLESLPSARAGGSGPTLRYLQFLHVQGTLVDEWAPSGTVNAMVLSNILSPLESHKSDITVLSGVDNPSFQDFGVNGHVDNGRTIFTCAPNSGQSDLAAGPSIDQVIAERLSAPTPYRSLQFGIGGPDVAEYQALYAGAADPVPLDGDPVAVFDQLFADLENDPTQAPTTMQRLRARRQSVLDGVLDSFDALQGRVSAADRHTLELHAEKIRQLEIQLGNTGNAGAGCTTPVVELPEGYQSNADAWDYASSRVFIDLMVMALACDMTRVGTLAYTNYHSPLFPWLSLGIPLGYDNWHALVHDMPNMADLEVPRTVFRWYMEELAYLLDQLALMPDADGTLLDNMLVLSTAEMATSHDGWGLPFVLAGRVGGQLQPGRHLDLGGATNGEVYTTFLNWFGGDDTVFGNPAYCSGPVTI